jgi:chromosome segregation ATPase
LRLRQLDEAIAITRREEQAEATRRAIKDERQAKFDARPSTLAGLEQQRAELSARLIEQQTHLRATAEQEQMRSRAARLDGDIEALRRQLATAEGERATLNA